MTSEVPWLLVLTWNSSKRLHISLNALQKLKGTYQVLIVDNGSADDTAAKAAELLPQAHILKNSTNLGFAGGNNVGIRFALSKGASHVVLVNDDLALELDWLEHISEYCRRKPGSGIAGGCIRFLGKSEYVNSTGLEVDFLWRATDRDFMTLFSSVTRPSGDVFAMTGGAMWISREVFEKIGLLDETFFAYYEDLDFCLRAKRAGFGIDYVAPAVSYHQFSGSLGENHPRRRYLLARNHLRTVGLYAPVWLAFAEIPAVLAFRILFKTFQALIKRHKGVAVAEIKGAIAGSTLAIKALVARLF